VTPAQERNCLGFNPFEGDRDTRVRLLRDEFVTARYPHTCGVCVGTVRQGARHRARTEIYDGEIGTFRFCVKCCEAMADVERDHGKAIERRYALGQERAR
jgi:hypothetical protein